MRKDFPCIDEIFTTGTKSVLFSLSLCRGGDFWGVNRLKHFTFRRGIVCIFFLLIVRRSLIPSHHISLRLKPTRARERGGGNYDIAPSAPWVLLIFWKCLLWIHAQETILTSRIQWRLWRSNNQMYFWIKKKSTTLCQFIFRKRQGVAGHQSNKIVCDKHHHPLRFFFWLHSSSTVYYFVMVIWRARCDFDHRCQPPQYPF